MGQDFPAMAVRHPMKACHTRVGQKRTIQHHEVVVVARVVRIHSLLSIGQEVGEELEVDNIFQ